MKRESGQIAIDEAEIFSRRKSINNIYVSTERLGRAEISWKREKNESLNKHNTRFQLTFVEKAIVSVARRTRICVVSTMQRERERKKEKEKKRKKKKVGSLSKDDDCLTDVDVAAEGFAKRYCYLYLSLPLP